MTTKKQSSYKKSQRERDKRNGIVRKEIRVHKDDFEAVKNYVAKKNKIRESVKNYVSKRRK